MTETPTDTAQGPTPPNTDQGPRINRNDLRDLSRLRRSSAENRVAGVAGGLARFFDVDPLVVRVAFVVLTFFGGAGLLLYGAVWLLVPYDNADEAALRLDDRSRTIALLLAGGLAALALLGSTVGVWDFPWPLAVIGLFALIFIVPRSRQQIAAEASERAPHPGVASAPGAPAPTTYSTRPVNPRRRGPILFWFTLALIALSMGTLGVIDLAGAAIVDSAYPATALGVIGLMLVVGSFYGRAGGLIALGLIAALCTAGATAAGEIDAGKIEVTPQVAASLDRSYRQTAGEIVIDLTEIADLDALDGRTLDLDVRFGRIHVLVPEGLNIDADAEIRGAGHTDLFGVDRDDSNQETFETRSPDAPTLKIDAIVSFGEIEMETSR